MKATTLLSLMAALCFSFQLDNSDGAYRWPAVVPMEQSYDFRDVLNVEPKVDANIRSLSGEPLYRLLCHSGDYDGGPDLHYKDENFDFSGIFDCHLHSLYSGWQGYGSLLPDDPLDRRDTLSRARLLGDDVFDRCAVYPEYGAVRQFRLRGMKIEFRFSEVVFSQMNAQNGSTRVESFRFHLGVKPDSSAISAIAEQVNVDYPHRLPNGHFDCDGIVHRHIPGVVTAESLKQQGLEPPYPQVQAAEKKAVLSLGQTNSEFVLPVQNVTGQSAYLLRCTNRGRWGINCSLTLPGKDVNLLEDSVDPYSRLSRSIILAEQLDGSCARYPEWGARRIFRLRHLKITLEFANAELTSARQPREEPWDAVKKVELAARVLPDPSADSPVAGPPKYAYWGFLPKTTCQTPIQAPR